MKRTKIFTAALLILTMALTACTGGKDEGFAGVPEGGNGNVMQYFDAIEYADEAEHDDESWRNEEITPNEQYGLYEESPFKSAAVSPLSTFSANPNTASYSNIRRFINGDRVPPPQSIRIEEMVNYFRYDYPAPTHNSEHPFTINTEVAVCPWNSDNLLAMIGIQGESLANKERLPRNIVLLIDVSGSMNSPERLPMVKESFVAMIERFNEKDVVSIVTYAGNSRIEADSISGANKSELTKIINGLSAGGSTAGATGILEAYELAEKNFIEGGNNRIILATDGDFNVGVSSRDGLVELIEKKRNKGIFISVLGYGMHNLNDYMMESIAKHGNGNYAYVDTIEEAKKVLVDEFDSTMYVIARDLKIQVEFNPAVVKEYRLIGYDNRRLNNEDFNNDAKDAGDIGAGFAVTAFYELVLSEDGETSDSVDGLTYQTSEFTGSSDFMNVKIRYKAPDGDTSKLVEKVVGENEFTETPSDRFNFASAVAEFGLILSESKFSGNASVSNVISRAKTALSNDHLGFKSEFVSLVERYSKGNHQ